MVKKLSWKKVLAWIGLGLIAGATIGAFAFPTEVVVKEPVIVEKEKLVEVPVIEYVNITKEVPVESFIEVEVDNGDMDFVLCRLEDKDIIEDCDEIVAELKAEDKALALALEAIDDADFLDMLEDENIIKDEDEAEVIKVYSDFEDVEILRSDFDDEEYKFRFEVKVEDLDKEVKKKVLVTVSVEDGDVELLKVAEV